MNAIISNNTFKVTICDLKNKDRNLADNIENQDKGELVANCDQFNSLKHSAVRSYAFTEQGVAMLSTILRSETAIRVNIRIHQMNWWNESIEDNTYKFQEKELDT